MEFDLYLDKIKFGYDGVIQEINFFNRLKAVKIITTMRNEKNNYIVLEIIIKELEDSKFYSRNNVLYDGIKYNNINGLHYLNLDSPNTNEELKNIKTFKESNIYFIGKDLSYSVRPYEEIYNS